MIALLAGCPGPRPPLPASNLFTAPPSTNAYAGPPPSTGASTKTSAGLEIQDVRVGTGTMAESGHTVVVNYIGWLKDGRVFESTRSDGPFTFQVGKRNVILGWDMGIPGMKVGGIRRLVIPADLAYGNRPAGRIPANSTLTFDIELLDAY